MHPFSYAGYGEDGEPIVDKKETCEHVLALPSTFKHDDVTEVSHGGTSVCVSFL